MLAPSIPDWARRRPTAAAPADQTSPLTPPRVVLVGPCAAGKSTLRSSLEACGVSTTVCGQEHSEIAHLWALGEPDWLIYLSVDLATVRQRRRNPRWSAAVYRRQLQRLESALACCDIYIDTSRRTPDEVLAVAQVALLALRPSATD